MVDHELTLEDFTDTFAQMLVYGLFMARLNSAGKKIDLFNVERYIPTSFELIHELVSFLKELDQKQYSETRWIVEEVLAVLNTMDLGAITALLSFDKHNKKADPEIARDPYIYFYEDFLAAYDKALKKARGVYYTPPPVVNFIIRAVNDVLKDTFNIKDGLADHKRVTLLDFACGTGTFLLEAIRLILDETPPAKRELIVKEHILKNLYGFEYMIAPYTVAHLKLTQYLKMKVKDYDAQEHMNIILTNTLEDYSSQSSKKKEYLLPALSNENDLASKVKNKSILVITGNPPYNYESQNVFTWIEELKNDYYIFNGEKIKEKQTRALKDDYVKFIRFAQWKIDSLKEGIVAIITNNSFIDNPTCRGMRQCLARTFNQIYVLDLARSIKKIDQSQVKDENVFDIKQGVCISIMVKTPNSEKFIKYADIQGQRKIKYNILSNSSVADINWESVDIEHQDTFLPYDTTHKSRYDTFIHLPCIFTNYNVGVKTANDVIAIHMNKESLERILNDFRELKYKEIKDKYSIKEDSQGWKLENAIKDVIDHNDENLHIKILYRPFDIRWTFYSGKSNGFISRPAFNIMEKMGKDNFAILFTRQCIFDEYSQISISDLPIDMCTLSSETKENAYIAPLYNCQKEYFLGSLIETRQSNISDEVIKALTAIFSKEKSHFTPESIFGYIYSILHSPTYREKYKDFLKTDFPRIPFCEDYGTFEALSALGWRLINAHLMKSDEPRLQYPQLGQYQVPGGNVVEKVFYTDSLQRLNINDRQYFAPVPEELYTFHIGGYQVLNKYLKDRKGRNLSLDEIENVENIVRVLAFTRDIMQEIDVRTRDWI